MVENLPTKQFSIADVTAMRRVFALTKRIRAVAGGTSASKTVSILVWLIDYCQSARNVNKLATVVSESYPHLSGGAMLDFELIMKDRGYWVDGRWVKTPVPTYTFETGNRLEFRTVDTYGKAHGPRRDVLFLNECNNLAYLIADQLITRTRQIVWLDWNPTTEFWFYTEMLGKRDDIDFITLTYKDNEALDLSTIKEIESHMHNKAWWQVYGLGQLGELENRIYTGWGELDAVPNEARLVRYGLDFGYSNDPTAIVAIYKWNDSYVVDELLYQKGLFNKDIAGFLATYPRALTIADAAEPKSVDEIKSYGLTIVGSQKGPGSVLQGINYVQSQKLFVTKRSLNILKEYRNYTWIQDDNGKYINEPTDMWNHTMDAIRYGLDSFRSQAFHQNNDPGGVLPMIPGTLA